jgi:hypothetical protein
MVRDPAYHPIADGDVRTAATRDAGVDVVGGQRLPRSAAHPFYTRLNQILEDRHARVAFHHGLLAPYLELNAVIRADGTLIVLTITQR